MRASGPSCVFISYSHRDGAELAQRLQKDLTAKGFDVWIDKQRLKGGASWTNEIEAALDKAKYVLALLTPGSYISDICRAEQLRSLRKGKCVIPLLVQRGTDIPLHLETKNYREFTTKSAYAKSFALLLKDIRTGSGASLKKEFTETYVTAPPLPINFVERPEELTALRNVLITDDVGRHIALTALEGMGGIGKTVLAQSLCHDEVVQQAFPDGVVWVSIGRESTSSYLTRMREVCKALGDKLLRYDNNLAAKNQYRNTIRKKVALVVVDDVWTVEDLEPFLAESTRSRLLFTTRDVSIAAGVGAREHIADLLTEEQSRDVLSRWSRTHRAQFPPMADDLIRECGRLPLALSMVGAMLRGKPEAFWRRILKLLHNADLEKISAKFPGYPYKNLLAALKVSADELDATTRERYFALAVLLEDMSIAPAIQQVLWHADETEAVDTAEKLLNLSLAQRDGEDGSIRLHDLQLDYVRAHYADKEALDLIHEALRRSSKVIADDPAQFASQVVGRLLYVENQPTVDRFLNSLRQYSPYPWLRPVCSTLGAASGEFIRTLAGHTSPVTAVAVTSDGKRVVSASRDRTLKLWDLASGHEVRTLTGHSDCVNAVALISNGQRAVSGSNDATLKVWDLASGRELRTLTGHSSDVTAVAVTPDGQRAVSASRDGMVKVWDLASGCELFTLEGHKDQVTAVAVTPDGRRAISASHDATLRVWDLVSGCELLMFKGHSNAVNAVAVMPDGQRAVSASDDRTLKMWDLSSGRELRTLTLLGYVTAVAVMSDGERALSASGKQLKVWDLTSGRELRSLKGHSTGVVTLAVTADGRHAVSAAQDEMLKVWDLSTGCEPRIPSRHWPFVTAVAVTPDGKCAVSASRSHSLKVWDACSGRELHTIKADVGFWRKVLAVTPDGQRAVSASRDGMVKVWDLTTGRELFTLEGHKDQVTALAVTPDGQRAVSASRDGMVKVWDLTTGRELRTSKANFGHWETALAVTSDGQRAVSRYDYRTLKVWDLSSGQELFIFTGHRFEVTAVALTADRQIAVSASHDKTLKVWALADGCELLTLKGHSREVNDVAVTPDGRCAVSVSDDRTLKVWDLETGESLTTFTGESSLQCCAITRDGKVIVAGGAFGAGGNWGHVHFLRLEEPTAKRQAIW